MKQEKICHVHTGLAQLAEFYKVTTNDLVNPSYIYKKAQKTMNTKGFDASRYGEFADEISSSSQLES